MVYCSSLGETLWAWGVYPWECGVASFFGTYWNFGCKHTAEVGVFK